MKRLYAVLGAAGLALSLALGAAAQTPGAKPGKGRGGGGGVKRIETNLAQLNLTTEQKPKVDKLVADAKEQLKTIRTGAGTPEEKKAKSRTAMKGFREKLNAILTDQQEAKLKELMPRKKPGAARKPGAAKKPKA